LEITAALSRKDTSIQSTAFLLLLGSKRKTTVATPVGEVYPPSEGEEPLEAVETA